jgi:hypothetical protein
MAAPQRDPHAHRSARVTNEAPIGFTWKWDSQSWTIPPATYDDDGLVRPGEAIVPYNAVRVHLGDPESIDAGRNRFRTDEYRRVRIKAGVNEFNESFHCEPGSVPDEHHRSPNTDKMVGEVWWTPNGMPPLRAYDAQTGDLLSCPAYDPEGAHVPTAALVLNENASLQEQMAVMRAQMQVLLAKLDDADVDPDAEPETPVPEPVKPMTMAPPRKKRPPKSPAEQERIGAGVMAGISADIAGVPQDRSH